MEGKTDAGGIPLAESSADTTDRVRSNLHPPPSAGTDEKHEAKLQQNAVTEDPQLAFIEQVPTGLSSVEMIMPISSASLIASAFEEFVALSAEEQTIPMPNSRDLVKETSLSVSASTSTNPACSKKTLEGSLKLPILLKSNF